MICVLSLVVFSILGIFSTTHRELAREAFVCVKNRAVREPCDTRLDERVQASVVGEVLNRSPRTAKVLNNHFELFSLLALILLILSGLTVGIGTYNYIMHGNCNGADSDEGCAANSIEEKLEELDADENESPKINDTDGEVIRDFSGVPG